MKLFLLFFLIFAGCQSKKSGVTHFDGNMMTMHYHVIVGETLTPEEKDRVQLVIDETFFQVNQIFNRFNPQSELSRINQLKSGMKMEVSDSLWELLVLTDRIVQLTDGRFDPTVWTTQRVWKEHLENGKKPNTKEIFLLAKTVGWKKIHLEHKKVWKDYDQTELDLSGIAKGHAIDLLIRKLRHIGYQNVYVEWGGEIAASGLHPEKRPWTIAITPPTKRHPDHTIEIISLSGQGVATSGDYIQHWRVEDEMFTHIIDPVTCTPLKRCDRSVTVCAPSCAMADALATAAMVAESPDEVNNWITNLDGVTCWFFAREGCHETAEEFEKLNHHP